MLSGSIGSTNEVLVARRRDGLRWTATSRWTRRSSRCSNMAHCCKRPPMTLFRKSASSARGLRVGCSCSACGIDSGRPGSRRCWRAAQLCTIALRIIAAIELAVPESIVVQSEVPVHATSFGPMAGLYFSEQWPVGWP